MPRSVPASFEVKPDRKWYCICSVVRRETGGRTPNASAARKITFDGWPRGHRLDDIVDMRQRIGDAGVFGFAAVGIIHAAVSAHYHVFQQRIAADGAINLRLRLRIEIDGLSVAAAFEVKHAVIVPTVLIIADQLTMRIGRQGGFPGPGEAEEQRHVPCFATVGRAVHRRDAFLRQQVVHDENSPFFISPPYQVPPMS